MSWLLLRIEDNLGAVAALIAFPVVVWMALSHYLPIHGGRRNDKDTRND
jgi:hypothetical protein